MRSFTIFRDMCRIRIHVAMFCIGIGKNQFFPEYIEHASEELEHRYRNKGVFHTKVMDNCAVNSFSKQRMNYGKRARHRG